MVDKIKFIVVKRLLNLVTLSVILISVTALLLAPYFLTDKSGYALAVEQEIKKFDPERPSIELTEHIRALRTRIWQLEDRVRDKPNDIRARSDLVKLRQILLQQLNLATQKMEAWAIAEPDSGFLISSFIYLKGTVKEAEIRLNSDYHALLNLQIDQVKKELILNPNDTALKQKLTKLQNEKENIGITDWFDYIEYLRDSIDVLETVLKKNPYDDSLRKTLIILKEEKISLGIKLYIGMILDLGKRIIQLGTLLKVDPNNVTTKNELIKLESQKKEAEVSLDRLKKEKSELERSE